MVSQPQLRLPRRAVLARGATMAGGIVAATSLGGGVAGFAAEGDPLSVSGGGVNLKLMPGADGGAEVPLRELFSVDAHYAQCVIEDNPAAFAMETFAMGEVVIEPHTFFMAMYANEVSLVGIYDLGNGQRMARLTGALGCATEAGTASGRVGSREAIEPAFFDIEAVDGGHGGGASGDYFVFKVYFNPQQAPVNHDIFGPEPTFTGEMIAGEITIAAAATLPLVPSVPGTPVA